MQYKLFRIVYDSRVHNAEQKLAFAFAASRPVMQTLFDTKKELFEYALHGIPGMTRRYDNLPIEIIEIEPKASVVCFCGNKAKGVVYKIYDKNMMNNHYYFYAIEVA
jgi:hypothetical protein